MSRGLDEYLIGCDVAVVIAELIVKPTYRHDVHPVGTVPIHVEIKTVTNDIWIRGRVSAQVN